MSRNRLINIIALGVVVLIVAIFAVLLVSYSGKQPQVSENTPVPGTEEPSPSPVEPSATLTLATTESPSGSGEKVQIWWFVGEAGMDPGQLGPQQEFVDQFNASHEDIELVGEFSNESDSGDLARYIAEGNAPDIVGPMGIPARDRFKGEWLDLNPLIEAKPYDLSVFDPASVKFLEVKGEGQLSIPFAIYPSFIFVNKDLFDQAGLPYPPQQFGAPYVDENGNPQEWNMDTLRDLAMRLTIDVNGNDANSPAFNPTNIVQFGFMSQDTDMRGALTMFGPGSLVDESGKAQMPDHWREGAHWIYDAMWKDHFWPTDAYVQSDVLAPPNPFASGHLAMAQAHQWFAAKWALDDIDFVWDTAVMPSYQGITTAKMQVNTFGILKTSKHPQEAFEVLTYMLSQEHAPELLAIYGGMPARLSLQGDYFENYGATVFPGQEINWQVVIDSAAYADIPNHEVGLPGGGEVMPYYYYTREALSKYGEYWRRWAQEPDLDLDAEIDALLVDLQTIYDESN